MENMRPVRTAVVNSHTMCATQTRIIPGPSPIRTRDKRAGSRSREQPHNVRHSDKNYPWSLMSHTTPHTVPNARREGG